MYKLAYNKEKRSHSKFSDKSLIPKPFQELQKLKKKNIDKKGTVEVTNIPGVKWGACSWMDSVGNAGNSIDHHAHFSLKNNDCNVVDLCSWTHVQTYKTCSVLLLICMH